MLSITNIKVNVKCGIENFRWHDLRHTCANWHRKAGTPTYVLQRLGAWKTPAMVKKYAHISPENLVGASARLEDLLSIYDLASLPSK
jgi:integrase